MTTQPLRLDTSTVQEVFENHLNELGNNRIIFTGPFGVGKTTFLKEVLNKNSYNNFWINPVKYSVGQNEDIFEYIKFDLISDICLNHFRPDQKEKIPESLFMWSYLNNNGSRIISLFFDVISNLEPTTAPLKSIINSFKKEYAKYKTHKDEIIKEDRSQNEIFNEYLLGATNKIGSIFEDDLITQSIRCYLEYLKEDSKENILIIDDFDRIDPEHVFRILNIFSVHNDYLNSSYNNKFGFDKIIIICDIDSIESYFYHKYGVKANFDGYMDKFCTTQYFRFSNAFALRNFCEQNLLVNHVPKGTERVLQFIIEILRNRSLLTLRRILKFRYKTARNEFIVSSNLLFNTQDLCQTCGYIETDELCVDTTNFPFFHCISILANIFGDYERLRKSLYEIANMNDVNVKIPKDLVTDVVNSIAPISHLAKHHNQISPLCYDVNKEDDMRFGRSHKKHIQNPKINFMETSMTLQFVWNKKNKYTGEQCYFKDVSVEFPSSENLRSVKLLFLEIINVMDFLKNQGHQYKI